MAHKCKECKTEENVRKLTIPVNSRKGRVLKTKKIWLCGSCVKTHYPDYADLYPTVGVRGREVSTEPRN